MKPHPCSPALPSSLPPATAALISRALADPSPPDLDPVVIWQVWSALICEMVAIGYPKTTISRYTELPGSCSTGVSRHVMYPKSEDWMAREHGLHHNSGQVQPWRSTRVAGQLYRAIRNLSRLPLRHHYGISQRAQEALSVIHQQLEIEDETDAATI